MGLIMLNLTTHKLETKIHVSQTITVCQLYQLVKQKIGEFEEDMDLIWGGGLLEKSSNETIDKLGMKHGDRLDFVINVIGGSQKLTSLPGYIEITCDPCSISYDADPTVKRARMPCQCVIDPNEIKRYCDTVINSGRFIFACPSCQCGWQYFLVRHVMSTTMPAADFEVFQRKVNENLLSSSPAIQECPTCGNYLRRDPSKEFLNKNWVLCPICTKRNGRRVEFCWICRNAWKGDTNSCGNPGCNGKDPRIDHLEKCDSKTIGKVSGVPTIRCCVKCGALINHKDKCKHMTCKCGYTFCFVCLKPKSIDKGKSEWQCGEWNDACQVAPRQANLFDL